MLMPMACTNSSTCSDTVARRGEYVGAQKPKLLADEAEQRLVHHLILQVERQRRTLAAAEVFDVVPAPYLKRALEELALHGVGLVYLLLHAGVHLLPKRGTEHMLVGLVSRMDCCTSRVGVDDERGSSVTQSKAQPFSKMWV